MKYIYAVVSTVLWVAGWTIAQGFWQGLAAVAIPPYSWYLVVARAIMKYNLL